LKGCKVEVVVKLQKGIKNFLKIKNKKLDKTKKISTFAVPTKTGSFTTDVAGAITTRLKRWLAEKTLRTLRLRELERETLQHIKATVR